MDIESVGKTPDVNKERKAIDKMLPWQREEGWMDGWMREFNVTFAEVRPNRQAGTTVMR